MYKLEKEGFKYIPPICPRCGSLTITKIKDGKLECRRDGYTGRSKEFYVGKEREEAQKLFLLNDLSARMKGNTMKCKNIEDFRDTVEYKGKEFWVVGAGISLKKFPEDFFDDKLVIFINASVLAFSSFSTNENAYLMCHHKQFVSLINTYRPDLLHRCVCAYPKNLKKANIRLAYIALGEFGEEPIYMYRAGRNIRTQEEFDVIAKSISNKEDGTRYGLSYTTMHLAVQVAAVFGASKITLVGCEQSPEEEKGYACKGGMWFFINPSDGIAYANAKTGFGTVEKMFRGTKWMANAFKPYNIVIRKFFFDRGYEEV